jgi:tetratricopeptide (TPR) repeat protein
MTRVVLMVVVFVITPVWSAAQAPMPAPASPVPLPAQAPAPRPFATPVPPSAPVPPPVPPTPLDALVLPVRVDPLDFHFDFDLSGLMDFDVTVPDLVGAIAGDLALLGPQMAHAQAQASADAAQAAQAVIQADHTSRQRALEAQIRSFEAQMRAGDAYNAGLGALQQRQYERAIQAFDRVVEAAGARVDAALYWKAFSEFKLARIDGALQTIGHLQKVHPQSRYLNDARVLEAEVRKQSGQRLDPAQLDDDEIKLLAIQGLQRTEQAVPLLEGVLNGANSLNVKKRAIYVLALSSDPRARDILVRYAKGAGNPDLQLESVRLLVSRRDPQTTGAVLRELYESTADTAVRRTIVDAYRTPTRPGPAPGATSPLAATAAQDLVALYQHETDADLRRHIASVLVANGSIEQVVTVIRSEKDPRTRQRLVSTLSSRNNPRATQALVGLYGSLTDTDTREAIINTLAGQQNAEALIGLARAETNVQLRTRIVRQLSEMAPRSKAAADYLMEVIR